MRTPASSKAIAAALLFALPAGLGATACGDSSTSTPSDGSAPATDLVEETTTTEDVEAAAEYAENEFGYGQEISIRDGAFAPAELVAITGQDVIFHNETAAEQTIVFTLAGPDSAGLVRQVGPIAPGASLAVPLEVGMTLPYTTASNPALVGRIYGDPGTDTL